jgi:hypothetical protein
MNVCMSQYQYRIEILLLNGTGIESIPITLNSKRNGTQNSSPPLKCSSEVQNLPACANGRSGKFLKKHEHLGKFFWKIYFAVRKTCWNFPNESLIEFYSWGNFSQKLCRSGKFFILTADSAPLMQLPIGSTVIYKEGYP